VARVLALVVAGTLVASLLVLGGAAAAALVAPAPPGRGVAHPLDSPIADPLPGRGVRPTRTP